MRQPSPRGTRFGWRHATLTVIAVSTLSMLGPTGALAQTIEGATSTMGGVTSTVEDTVGGTVGTVTGESGSGTGSTGSGDGSGGGGTGIDAVDTVTKTGSSTIEGVSSTAEGATSPATGGTGGSSGSGSDPSGSPTSPSGGQKAGRSATAEELRCGIAAGNPGAFAAFSAFFSSDPRAGSGGGVAGTQAGSGGTSVVTPAPPGLPTPDASAFPRWIDLAALAVFVLGLAALLAAVAVALRGPRDSRA